MKKYLLRAAIIAAASWLIYPVMNDLAIAERGYDAIGSEETLLAFGILIAILVVTHGLQKIKAPEFEGEENEED